MSVLLLCSGRRRTAAPPLWLTVLLLSAACAERPPILLMVIDTLRADHLSAFGHERRTSPHLDALAADATLYLRAFSQAPWTTPSVASLLTSQFPRSLGIRDVESPLPVGSVPLSDLLRRHGYRTAAIVSSSFCSAKWGFSQGFDVFDESHLDGMDSVTSDSVTERAIALIETLAGRPFFLFLHYLDPHDPYIEHQELRFDTEGPAYDGLIRSPLRVLDVHAERAQLSAADVDRMKRIYDSEIAFTDAAIGRVIQRLRELELYEQALIVVTADHGEEFLEHGDLAHTTTLFNEVTHVPLLIKFPGRRAAVFEEPVGLVDVYPTIVDWLDLEPDLPLRGRSLLEAGGDAREHRTPVFMETSRMSQLQGVVLGRYKLIRDLETGELQLYDLSSDAAERRNLARSHASVATSMLTLLERWEETNVPDRFGADPVQLDAADRRRLRALGYLEAK